MGLALAPEERVMPYLRDCFDANSLIEQNPLYRIAQRDEAIGHRSRSLQRSTNGVLTV